MRGSIRAGRELDAGQRVRLGLRYFGNLAEEDEGRLRRAMVRIADLRLGRDAGRLEFDAWESQSAGQVGIDGKPTLREKASEDETGSVAAATSHRAQGEIQLELVTPAWLEHAGRLDERFTFADLVGHVYRRLTTLCSLYGQFGAEDDERYRALRELAQQVSATEPRLNPLHWERHSWESDTRHPMRGIVGKIRYLVPTLEQLAAFGPVCRMAEVTHIGKATSFGLGQIRTRILSIPADHAPTMLNAG